MLSLFNTGYGLQDQLDGVKNGIAIVATGNTHAAITSGQYVYIQDHGTLAEGLYRATANIAANGTLSGSNVTAVSGGGLNALNSNIRTANSINWVTTFSAQIEKNGLYLFTSQRYGDIILLTCFSDGNVGARVVTGNNWTLSGSNQTLSGTATNQADYAIIKLN